MFRFRLLDEDGNELGPILVAVPDWKPGHRIQRGADDALEVVRVVAGPEDDESFSGYLVVKPV